MRLGKFSVQYPREAADSEGNFSRDSLAKYYKRCVNFAETAIKKSNIPFSRHRTLILVDLQGVYIGCLQWLAEHDVPLDSGMVLSRFAHYLLEQVTLTVNARIVKDFEDGIVLNDLIRTIFRKEIKQLPLVNHVVDIKTNAELFFAPVPMLDIKSFLESKARAGSSEARRQLDDARKGFLHVHGSVRDYRHYDHFIECMKKTQFVSDSQAGFFNFYVSSLGLKTFDEKEVDARLVMRAVDASSEYEADSICIVSSDQDFMPIHARVEKNGVRTFQADVSNFATPEKVAKRVRNLDGKHIPVGIDRNWPMRAVCEAFGFDPFNGVPPDERISKGISPREFSALCRLHNDLNDDYHLEPEMTGDGDWSLNVMDPKRK